MVVMIIYIDGGDDGSDDNIDDGGDDIDGGCEVISQPLVSSIICLSLKNSSAPSKDLIINKMKTSQYRM